MPSWDDLSPTPPGGGVSWDSLSTEPPKAKPKPRPAPAPAPKPAAEAPNAWVQASEQFNREQAQKRGASTFRAADDFVGLPGALRTGPMTGAQMQERERYLRETPRNVTIRPSGYIDRQALKIGAAGVNIAAGLGRAASALTQNPYDDKPRDGPVSRALDEFAAEAERIGGTNIEGGYDAQEFLDNPSLGGAARLIAEEGPASLAITPLVMSPAGMATYGTSIAGSVGQRRAENDGRDKATLGDVTVAAPFAAASVGLERLGIEKWFGDAAGGVVRRIGTASATEGVTEVGQSVIEGVGEGLGTKRGVDWEGIKDEAIIGGVVGAGVGGGIRTGVEIADGTGRIVRRNPNDRRAPPPGKVETAIEEAVTPTQADIDSPLDTGAIAEGKAEIARAAAKNDVSRELENMGLPEIGSRVQVADPELGTQIGVLRDRFEADDGSGVVIELEDGKTLREYDDVLADVGITITAASPTAEADAIDARLAAAAEAGRVSIPDANDAEISPATPAQDTSSSVAPPPPLRPAAGGEGFDLTRYMRRNRAAESGGNDSAKAATSSATGRYQFTTGTWKRYYKLTFGNTGESDQQIIAKRLDGAVQDKVMARLTQDNVAAVKRTGAAVTDGNVYLAHFLGAGGAAAILKADPNTPVASLLNKGQISANKSILQGKTAGQVVAWASKKMGGSGAAPAGAASPTIAADSTGIDFGESTKIEATTREPIRTEIPTRRRDAPEDADTAVTVTGREIPVEYQLAELDDLTASNTSDGAVNPNYPKERQPRDRSRAASLSQIEEIAGNLNPKLLGRSPKAADGAPIISPAGVVESGNGRTLALQKVYEANGDRATAYRSFLEEQGFDTSGMNKPVLVRVRDGNLAEEDVQAFVREANARDTAGMSGTETAASDATALPSGLLGLFRGGDIDAAGNRDFVRGFMQALVPANERANLVLKDGSIAGSLIKRVEAALLVRAVGPRPFIEKLVDADGDNIKSIGKALVDVSGPLAQLREAVQSGAVDSAMDIADNIAEAVEIIERARREKKNVADLVDQRDVFSGETVAPLTEAVLTMLFNGPRFTRPAGRERIAERIGFYIVEAEKAAPGGGLFGPSTSTQPEDILALANERAREPAAAEQGDLLATRTGDGDQASAQSEQERSDGGDGTGVREDGRDGAEQRGESALSEPVEQGNPSGEPDGSGQLKPVGSPAAELAPEPAPEVTPEPAPAETAETTSASEVSAQEVATDAALDGNADAAPIEDFGEELAGARKHYAQAYRDRIDAAKDFDVADVPLSKSWPEPDYAKLLEDGADPYIVAWVHAARDEIPMKPRKGWKLKGWVTNVETLRDFSDKLLSGDMNADQVREKMDGQFSRSLRDLQGRLDLYQEVGHEKSLKGITLSFHHYSLYRGRENVDLWAVEQKAKATAFSNWPREIATGDTREEALAEFKRKLAGGALDAKKPRKGPKFEIYSYRSKPGKFIIGFKNGKNTVDLKEFDTVKDAREYRTSDEGDAWLLEQVAKFRDVPDHRRVENSPRVGINHRSGADVTPEQFSETFGFRGVQFGNYVEGARRQEDLNEAYDALMDLTGVLGVPSQALSLNGELGLAFGARGKGGKRAPKAHYEPGTVVINLTKKSGAGSLAHEWWHSLDNYFSRSRGDNTGFLTAKAYERGEGVRPEMVAAFASVMRSIKQSGLQQRSQNLDKRRTKAYWATDVEMSARAFESYVIAKLQDESFANDYLANIVDEKAWEIEDAYPYLTAGEIANVRAAFDEFFDTVETKQTEQGTALYSIPDEGAPVVAELTGKELGKLLPSGKMRMVMLRDRAMAWFGQNLLGKTVTASDGKPVSFTRKGMKKSTALKGDEILRVVPAIRAILEKGQRSDVPTKPGAAMRAEMFSGNVTLDGRTLRIGVIVRTDANGRRQYDLTNAVNNAAGYPVETGGAESSFPAMEGAPGGEQNIDEQGGESNVSRSGGESSQSIPTGERPASDFNLFLLDGSLNTDADTELDTAALREQLSALGLRDKVVLQVVDTLGGSAGRYTPGQQRLIEVATDTAQDAEFTLNHEAVHALREMGLFKDSEWKILVARAKREPGLMRSIEQRYRKLDREAREEEAVADLFARFQRGETEPRGVVAKSLAMLRGFMEALRNGFRTSAGIMQDVASGVVAGRQGLGRGTGPRDMVAYHGTPHDFDAFSLDAIGTGEGAQAYGWGLYFASRKEVAKFYRRQLAAPTINGREMRTNEFQAYDIFSQQNDDITAAVAEGQRQYDEYAKTTDNRLHLSDARLVVATLKSWQKDGLPRFESEGHLYEVDIPEADEYLDWDKPLSEQSEQIRRAVEQFDTGGLGTEGRNFYNNLAQEMENRGRGSRRARGGGEAEKAASMALLAAGIRGIRYLDGSSRDSGEGAYNYVVFDGADIRITAKHSIPETAETLAQAGTGPTWKGKMADTFDRWRTAMQDRYLPLLRVQQEIEKQTGRPLPENLNPYLGEELMTGRIGARLESLMEDNVRPLFDAMADEKVTTDALETYLYARHAPERNARIAEINPEFDGQSGSGMTNLEARAVMARINRDGKMEAMERLAARVDAIRDKALDYRVETGLMSQEDADAWRSTYEHYIPLRGFKEVATDSASAERINRSGGGINVRGKESRAAYGRRSQADSPLAYTILQAEEAIVRGETNRVAQRFVDLARANPDEGFWQINKVTGKRKIDPASGLVESYQVHQVTAEDKDFTISAKFNGKEVRVTLDKSNPTARRVADSMRNLTQHQLDWVTEHLGKLNRFLSMVNTQFNPEFVISNAFRDIQTATVNLTGLQRDGLVKGTLRDYPRALKASLAGAFRKGDGEWKKWNDEFRNEGGRVYFNHVEDVGMLKKRIAREAQLAGADKPSSTKAQAALHAKRMFFAAGDLIESMNLGVENAVRLSAYKNARENGMSKQAAASMAKNLTVNFNRRGTMGPAMNAAYLFYNASVQGTVRLVTALKSKRARRLLYGVMVGGAAVEMLNAMLTDDDDDGESYYDKIPAYVKERNLIIMTGGKNYVKIPLPYGYNVFWEGGRTTAEIARRGGKGWQESAFNLFVAAANSFNPVGGADNLLSLASPTILDPIVDLELNRDFTGAPIMPEQSPFDSPDPDHRRYFASVEPHWRAVAEGLNKVSGGDDVVPGSVSVSPETLEYLFGYAVGGAGRFVERVAAVPAKVTDPDHETTVSDFPFVRTLTGSVSPWLDKSMYYDRIGQIDQTVDFTKDYIEREQPENAVSFAERNAAMLSLEPTMKAAQKEMRIIRKARRANEGAYELGKITEEEYRAEKRIVDEAESMVVQQFNTQWNATVGYGRDRAGER